MEKLFLICALSMLFSGCAFWKPVAKTTNEVARVLCEEYATGRDTAGMSVKDWCKIQRNLDPFLDAVTGLEKAGVAR